MLMRGLPHARAPFTESKPGCTASLRPAQARPRGKRKLTCSSLYTAENPSATRQRLFGDIAPVYDQLNDRLSLGLHKVWKLMAVKWARVRPGDSCLDLCCGSGDLAFLLAKATGPTGQVVALDFAEEMLGYARSREGEQSQQQRQLQCPVDWLQGDALDLPFEDDSFDAVTMGYGLRNVASIQQALSELNRVLKPGCSASILDFNNASKSNQVADFVQGWALENVVVPTAASYGLEDEYKYVRPSILAFPTGLVKRRV